MTEKVEVEISHGWALPLGILGGLLGLGVSIEAAVDDYLNRVYPAEEATP